MHARFDLVAQRSDLVCIERVSRGFHNLLNGFLNDVR